MEPWEPPALARIAIYHSLLAVIDLWAVRHCVMFSDVALDIIRHRGGGGGFHTEAVGYSLAGYSPGKTYAAKRRALGFGLAGTLGCAARMVLCRFSERFTGGGVPLLSLRGSTWLNRQQSLLRALVLRLLQHPLVVEVRPVPGVLQPADPPSKLDSSHRSSTQRACRQAYQLWRVLLRHLHEVQHVGGLVL